MTGNTAIILIGLWLCYRAIFSIPAGNMSDAEMAVAGLAVAALAFWARRTDVYVLARHNEYHAGREHGAVGGRRARSRHRPIGIVLDSAARRYRGRHFCAVVSPISAKRADRSRFALAPPHGIVWAKIGNPIPMPAASKIAKAARVDETCNVRLCEGFRTPVATSNAMLDAPEGVPAAYTKRPTLGARSN